jgi:AcrR family transcriptional regulator
MVTRANRSPEPRAPLSRERILRTALDLADRHGIAALSMRKLGQELGVDAMLLYRHVANKDDLLDSMVDAVFGEIGLPPTGPDWRAAMRQRAVAARATLSRHPWAIGLMESRRRPGLASLRHHDAVLGNLREAGFSIEAAAHAYSILDSYIYGFTLNEQSLPLDTSEEVAEVGSDILRALPANAYPNLAEFISEHAMKPGYSYGDEFEFGLDLILDGLEKVRDAA